MLAQLMDALKHRGFAFLSNTPVRLCTDDDRIVHEHSPSSVRYTDSIVILTCLPKITAEVHARTMGHATKLFEMSAKDKVTNNSSLGAYCLPVSYSTNKPVAMSTYCTSQGQVYRFAGYCFAKRLLRV